MARDDRNTSPLTITLLAAWAAAVVLAAGAVPLLSFGLMENAVGAVALGASLAAGVLTLLTPALQLRDCVLYRRWSIPETPCPGCGALLEPGAAGCGTCGFNRHLASPQPSHSADRGHPIPDHCRACGYPTRGLPTGICPECGKPVGPAEPMEEPSKLPAFGAEDGARTLLACSVGLITASLIAAVFGEGAPWEIAACCALGFLIFPVRLAAREHLYTDEPDGRVPVAVYVLLTLGWSAWFHLALLVLYDLLPMP